MRKPGFGHSTAVASTTLARRAALSQRGGRMDDRHRPAARPRRHRLGTHPQRAAARRARQLPGDGLPVASCPARRPAPRDPRHRRDRRGARRHAAHLVAAAPAGFRRDPVSRRDRQRRCPRAVEAMVAEADLLSPVLDAVARDNHVIRSLSIVGRCALMDARRQLLVQRRGWDRPRPLRALLGAPAAARRTTAAAHRRADPRRARAGRRLRQRRADDRTRRRGRPGRAGSSPPTSRRKMVVADARPAHRRRDAINVEVGVLRRGAARRRRSRSTSACARSA